MHKQTERDVALVMPHRWLVSAPAAGAHPPCPQDDPNNPEDPETQAQINRTIIQVGQVPHGGCCNHSMTQMAASLHSLGLQLCCTLSDHCL